MRDLLARSGWVRLGLLAVVVGGALSVLVGSAAATPVSGSCSTAAGTTTCTFTYTGAGQSFTVPAAVTEVTLDVFGAQGGDSQNGSGAGGAGGEATAAIAVTPGSTLTVQVGQKGASEAATTGGAGGFGGGGAGGGTTFVIGAGAGGGGASSVSNGADALLIAGGGGGATGWQGALGSANGGSGGGLAGGAGSTPSGPPSSGPAGAPGTQVAGGVGAGGSGSGALGLGGTGADYAPGAAYSCGGGGGGGGGGYYGGAGGSNCAGGGGGSGFASPAAISSTLTAGVHSGDGVVTISYAEPDSTAPTASPTQDPAANAAGWNNTDVTVYWHWADEPGGSGLGAISTCATPSTSTGEGTITLHSSCSDVAGNLGTADYTVKVDKTAPTFAPGDITVNATSPAGATVPTPGATDNLDPNPAVVCTPSGTLFPIGDTVVNCTATDAAGNSTPGSFTVHVKGAAEQLADLLAAVTGVGPGHALADTVKNIQKHVAKNQHKDACKDLDGFIKHVQNMATGKKPKISQTQADSFIAQARNIKATLGC